MPERKCAAASGSAPAGGRAGRGGVESTLLARSGGPLFKTARERGLRVEPLGLVRVMLLGRRHDLIHAHGRAQPHAGGYAKPGRLVVSRRVAFRWAPLGSTARRRYLAGVGVREIGSGGRGRAGRKDRGGLRRRPLLEPVRGSSVVAPANADDACKGAPLAVEAASLAGVELKLSTDLERDLRDAAVFVYITHSEGLGSGALLAMSAGVPVVASRGGRPAGDHSPRRERTAGGQ